MLAGFLPICVCVFFKNEMTTVRSSEWIRNNSEHKHHITISAHFRLISGWLVKVPVGSEDLWLLQEVCRHQPIVEHVNCVLLRPSYRTTLAKSTLVLVFSFVCANINFSTGISLSNASNSKSFEFLADWELKYSLLFAQQFFMLFCFANYATQRPALVFQFDFQRKLRRSEICCLLFLYFDSSSRPKHNTQ